MEDFIANIMLPSLVCGVIFCAMGTYLYHYPPKKINYLYGYRTGSSMKSQERWTFAQKFSALQMAKGGIAMIVISLLAYFVPLSVDIKQFTGVGVVVACCAYLFFTTEKALKTNFQN